MTSSFGAFFFKLAKGINLQRSDTDYVKSLKIDIMTTLEKTILGSWSISTASLVALRKRLAVWQYSLNEIVLEYYDNKHRLDALFDFELQYRQISNKRKVDLDRIRIINKYLVTTSEEINRLVVQ